MGRTARGGARARSRVCAKHMSRRTSCIDRLGGGGGGEHRRRRLWHHSARAGETPWRKPVRRAGRRTYYIDWPSPLSHHTAVSQRAAASQNPSRLSEICFRVLHPSCLPGSAVRVLYLSHLSESSVRVLCPSPISKSSSIRVLCLRSSIRVLSIRAICPSHPSESSIRVLYPSHLSESSV